jgi:hypothetical protein
VQYLVAASDCDAPAFAMFEAVEVVVLDESGTADTLSVGAGARISPLPTTSVSVSAVTPTELRSGEVADLEVSGRGFGPGTRVYIRVDGQRTQASSVAVEDSTALRAQVIPTFGAGEMLDLVVTRPLGGESALGNALTEIASTMTGTQSWAQIRPTTQDHPFTQIDVKAPTTYTHPPYGPDLVFHVHHGYPATLDSLELRVTRPTGDTVAVIWSQPTEGIGFDGYYYYPAGASFTLGTPAYATSLGTLVQGGNLFDGAAPNNDQGRSLMRCFVEYGADSNYWASEWLTYRVGTHVRNWTSGTLHCGEDSSVAVPLYAAAPTDSLAVPLDTGSPSLHYDFQERHLSGRERTHQVSRISFSSVDSFPGTCVNNGKRTSSLFGATLWSQFQITSPWTGDTLHTQLQTDTTWSARPYGGKYWRGDLIGTDASIDSLGCALTCFSAVHTYFGLPCTPDTLQEYLLQTTGGYLPFPAIVVDTTALSAAFGDTLPFTWSGRGIWPSGTTLVVSNPDTVPRALIRIVSRSSVGGQAIVTRVYDAPTAQDLHGCFGVTFSILNMDIASRGFSGMRWRADSAHYKQVTADTIEAALRDSLPVLLYKSWPNKATHWVVGKGMQPVWPHAGGPKGTYAIMDPSNKATTLYGTYGNFCYAGVRCVPDSQPAGGGMRYCAESTGGGSAVRGLAIIVAADAGVTLVDPSNRRLSYDATEEGYSSTIPGASVLRGLSRGRWDDSTNVSAPFDLITLPDAGAGEYTLVLTGGSSGNAAVAAEKYDTEGYSSAAFASVPVDPYTVSRFRVVHDPVGSVSLTLDGVGAILGVQPTGEGPRLALEIRPNPIWTHATIALTLNRERQVEVAVFDVLGRRVARPVSGRMAAGTHSIAWPRGEAGVAPGVYVIRLATENVAITRRVVVLGGRR